MEYLLRNTIIESDSQYLYPDPIGRNNVIYGRIKNIRYSNNILNILFFHTQTTNEKTYILEVDNNSFVCNLKRGDIIAFDGISENPNIIEKIVLLNSSYSFPEHEAWDDKSAKIYRELDVLLNLDSMRTMINRNEILFSIRQYLKELSFLEIELPILKRFPDVAPSGHFIVNNAEGFSELFLRTTNPYYEKLMVGFEKAFTIGTCFRNGDFSFKNLPEFNMFTTMVIGKHYLWTTRLLQKMFCEIAIKINNSSKIIYKNKEYDLANWDEVELSTAFMNILNVDINELDSDENLISLCKKEKVIIRDGVLNQYQGHLLRANLFDAIFEQRIVEQYANPTFFIGVPWYLCGPAEVYKNNPFLKLRGEGYIGGLELINSKCVLASYEKNDNWQKTVTDEKKRLGFGSQAKRDLSIMETIGYGFQPGSLASFGVDRLIMLILGKESVSDVIMYPLIREE